VCGKRGASGHSATECNQTGCSECGSTTHKSGLSFACPKHKCTNCTGLRSRTLPGPTSHLCPEHVCTLCSRGRRTRNVTTTLYALSRAECETCKLFGHVTKDCVCDGANCLDVEEDGLNILFTKCESIVGAYFTEVYIPAVSLRTDGIVRPISRV
jgi:hypothetical protein